LAYRVGRVAQVTRGPRAWLEDPLRLRNTIVPTEAGCRGPPVRVEHPIPSATVAITLLSEGGNADPVIGRRWPEIRT